MFFFCGAIVAVEMYTKRDEMRWRTTNYFHFTNKNTAVSFIIFSLIIYAMLICDLIYLLTLRANELESKADKDQEISFR